MKNPLKLTLDEIEDWEVFQDLVKDFFEALERRKDNQVRSVWAKKTGRGSDLGRDILVELQMHDGIQQFKRTWVVQCKFEKKALGLSSISNVGVKDLLDSYNADGYLLVSKSRVTSQLSQRLEELERSDRRGGRCYTYWEGPKLCTILIDFVDILRKYFPKYYAATQAVRRVANIDKIMEE